MSSSSWSESLFSDDKTLSLVEKQLECSLCFELMVEPVTTECGHTYCKHCLYESSLHSEKCPTCRTRLSGRMPAVNAVIQSLLEQALTEKYKTRIAETATVFKKELEEKTLGLFILDCILPRQHLKLHVFESRYRKLITRALESTPSMIGLIARRYGNERQLASVVTECEIIDYTLLPDGRYFCEVVGRRRLRLRRDWESEDGFRIAAVQEWKDKPITPEERSDIDELSSKLRLDVDTWIQKARDSSWTNTRRQVLELILQHLASPPVNDPEAYGLWITALINPLPALGIAPEIRLESLSLSSSIERLRLVQRAIHVSLAHLSKRGTTGFHRSALAFLFFLLARFFSLVIHAVSRALLAPIAFINRFLLLDENNHHIHQNNDEDQDDLGLLGRVHLPLEGVGQ